MDLEFTKTKKEKPKKRGRGRPCKENKKEEFNILFNDDARYPSLGTINRALELSKSNKQKLSEEREKFSENLQQETEKENELSNLRSNLFEDDRKGAWYRTKSLGGNAFISGFADPLRFLGLAETALVYPAAKLSEKINGEEGPSFGEILEENDLYKSGEELEKDVRDTLNIANLEEMDRLDQAIHIGTLFAGVPAVGVGTKFLPRTATDTVLQSIPKSLGRYSLDIGEAALLPGVQLSKDADIITKGTQAGIQALFPLAANEAVQYQMNRPGLLHDYSEKELEPEAEDFILAKRKDAKSDKIYDATIFNNEEEKSFDDKLREFYYNNEGKILTGAGILGGGAAIRYSKFKEKIIKDLVDKQVNRRNQEIFAKTLTPGQQLMGSLDATTIIDIAVEKGLIDENVAKDLYRNTYQQTNNAFETGNIYIGDELQQFPSPRGVINEISVLKLQNNPAYNSFYSFMEKARQISHEVYEYNMNNAANISPLDAVDPKYAGKLNIKGYKTFGDAYIALQDLYKNILKNPEIKPILQKISDINNATVDRKIKLGLYSPEFADKIRKNRTFFGYNLYDPGVPYTPQKTFMEKVGQKFNNLFKSKSLFKDTIDNQGRSIKGTFVEALPWDQTFEKTFKDDLKQSLNEYNTKILVENLQENYRYKLNALVSEASNTLNALNETSPINTEALYKLNNKLNGLYARTKNTIDNIKFLGTREVNGTNTQVINKNPLFHLLNITEEEATDNQKTIAKFVNSMPNDPVGTAMKNEKTSAGILKYTVDDKDYFYQVDDWLGQIVKENPQRGVFFNAIMKKPADIMKSFVTGKVNPFFAPITGSYTLTDQALSLRTLNRYVDNPTTKLQYFKNAATSYIDSIKYKYKMSQLNTLYNELRAGRIKNTPKIQERLTNLQNEIANSPMNLYKAAGASIQGRYALDTATQYTPVIDDGFIINTEKSLKQLQNMAKVAQIKTATPIKAGLYGLDMAKYIFSSFRDAPTLGLYKSYSKNFMTDGKLDANKIIKFSKLVDRYTSSGIMRTSSNPVGAFLVKTMESIPYLSDMLSENIARGRQVGAKSVVKHVTNLLDRTKPVSKELKDLTKDVLFNDYVKSATEMLAIPVTLASFWNHSSPENEALYDALPDNVKNKGIVLVNVINGKNITIPLTQSMMWIVTALREGVTDNLFRLNNKDYNAADTFGSRLASVAGLNWNVNMPTTIGLGLNAAGYMSPSVADAVDKSLQNKPAFSQLKNQDDIYSNTYYENGLFGPRVRQFSRGLFGNVGGAVTEGIDKAVNTGDISTGLRSGADTLLTSAYTLFDPMMNTYNKTSGIIYKKEGDYKRLSRAKNLTPEQQSVREVINLWHNSRTNLINQKIKEIQKEVKTIKGTGKGIDNENYRDSINRLNRQILRLQSYALKDYEKLDKLLKQNYNITYDEFMEGIK